MKLINILPVTPNFPFRQWFIEELTGSPINVVLLLIICFLIYKLVKPESGKFQFITIEPILLT